MLILQIQQAMSNSTRCAACKSLRRRCSQDCVLAPYFPSNNPQRFDLSTRSLELVMSARCLRRIQNQGLFSPNDWGTSGEFTRDAAECISFEATWRVRDPVYGCVGIISHLQQQIIQTQIEITNIYAEIALHKAQQEHSYQVAQSGNSFDNAVGKMS
ncbi:unnamed protein product, partial [Thlaspi arvense]